MEGNDFHLVGSLLLPKNNRKKKESNRPKAKHVSVLQSLARVGFTQMEYFARVKLKNGCVD